MKNSELFEKHMEKHGEEADSKIYFAPGRINLIGEHLDYNGGTVFPGAINLGTYAVVNKRKDSQVNVFSNNFAEFGVASIDLNDIRSSDYYGWASYVAGAFKLLKEKCKYSNGLNITIHGTLPNRSGLSSSASIELLMIFIIQDIYDINLNSLEMAKTGKQIENDYMLLPSGIMDQYAVAFGEEKSAISLDCNAMTHKVHTFDNDDYEFIVINTNKPRELISSEYKNRKTECEKALDILNALSGKDNTYLTDYNLSELEMHKEKFEDEILYKRAFHVIDENTRTLLAVNAFDEGAFHLFGELMYASHESLRNMYEVTGNELDTIIHTSRNLNYVLGARMTGAGFGGSAVALVAKNHFEQYKESVEEEYSAAVGYRPSLYQVRLSQGPTIIKEGAH